MDYQNRAGSKFGGGGVASEAQEGVHRRERLKRLALETIDLQKDPYFMRNHLGTYECKLCLTVHPNEGNYLAHTQGKRHTTNLARRNAREAAATSRGVDVRTLEHQKKRRDEEIAKLRAQKKAMKLGRPGYRVTKLRDPTTMQRSLIFEISYPDIDPGLQPRHRFMSAYEQKVETVDRNYQYLLFAAEPYQTIAFKIPNVPIDREHGKFTTSWDEVSKTFKLQLHFVSDRNPDSDRNPNSVRNSDSKQWEMMEQAGNGSQVEQKQKR